MNYQRWSHPQDDLKTAARLSNPLYQKCESGSLAQKRDKSLNSMVVIGSWALTIATKGHVDRLELKDLLSFRRRELGHAWHVSWSIFHRFFKISVFDLAWPCFDETQAPRWSVLASQGRAVAPEALHPVPIVVQPHGTRHDKRRDWRDNRGGLPRITRRVGCDVGGNPLHWLSRVKSLLHHSVSGQGWACSTKDQLW